MKEWALPKPMLEECKDQFLRHLELKLAMGSVLKME
jgi:hypothetical protein